ncbi:MAG: serine/threonine-protein phosphatase [Bacteroidetes bacterium]|nr:serine/threonine-protein phosphatase [Bacteroidota bacterium]
MSDSNPIKRIFDLYTSDLSYQEIERLVKKEASEVYEFFSKDIPKPDPTRNKITRGFIFSRSLFNAFILKLTPARRIFYLVSLLFFLLGYFSTNSNPGYILLAFIILNLLLAFELADKLSAKSELDVARNIQFDLIPKHSSKIFNYNVASYYEPARDVGGDYFDIVELHERCYIFIGDISGKGMAAALYMVRVQSILHMLLESLTDVRELIINFKKLFAKNLRREYFLTLNAASVESNGKIRITRAGHSPVFWYRHDAKQFEVICPQGLCIGLNDKGVFEKTLEEVTVHPGTNDIVFFYTDGVNETMNVMFQQFGDENIKRVIQNNCDKPVEEIKNSLLRAIKSFRGTAHQYDDLTFVILKAD